MPRSTTFGCMTEKNQPARVSLRFLAAKWGYRPMPPRLRQKKQQQSSFAGLRPEGSPMLAQGKAAERPTQPWVNGVCGSPALKGPLIHCSEQQRAARP